MNQEMPKNVYELAMAIKECDALKVEALVQTVASVNINFETPKGPTLVGETLDTWETLLGWAAIYGTPPILTLLLNRGAEVNRQNAHGSTPLALAARHLKEKNVKRLLDFGASTTLQNSNGDTPLSMMLTGWAAIAMNEGQMTELCGWCYDRLAEGCPEVTFFVQGPCEDCASFQSKREKSLVQIGALIKLLIAAGSDPHLKNKAGESAYSLVKECYGSTSIQGIFSEWDLKEIKQPAGMAQDKIYQYSQGGDSPEKRQQRPRRCSWVSNYPLKKEVY